jgi:dCTP deaminase
MVRSESPLEDDQLQPASVDLRLGTTCYQVRASFLPGKAHTVEDALGHLQVRAFSLRDGAILPQGAVYIVQLLEHLDLARKPTRTLLAKANPKSTTGRLDIFARLITDRADEFDVVERGYQGPLYVEIAPKTFHIKVRTGTRLNQLRFIRGRSVASHASRTASEDEALVYGPTGEPLKATIDRGIWFSVDLSGSAGDQAVGWKARKDTAPIDLDLTEHYKPQEFWDPVPATSQLILRPDDFYILGSKERVRVPPGLAAEMLPYDQAMGEFRVHYAGFFDPGFGHSEEPRGTRAILEVRSHEIPYALNDGQRIGRLMYERMIDIPIKLYGAGSGSSYQDQGLGLSKQFQRTIPRD